MNKFDPFALKTNDRFYYYEPRKGQERNKYRLAEVVYTTRYFIVANVLDYNDSGQSLYAICFNYNSVACGDVLMKDTIKSSEKVNTIDMILDM